MALPKNLCHGLLPAEAEYLATSNVEINIVPLMRIDRVRLLDGVYGPLRPPTQARVPLWMALNLKKRKRCSIVCPEWMEKDNLKNSFLQETMHDEFAPLPLHYIAISKVLLETAPDDVPDSDDVRAYLKSIREARQSKVLSGVEAVNTEHLTMTNISLGEVTELRRFLGTAFNHLRAIQRAGEPDEPESSFAQAEIDERQFAYALAHDTQQTTPGLTREAYRTPHTSRTANTPSWSESRVQNTTPGEGDSQQQDVSGTAEEGGEESMNNMDLF